MDSSSFDAYLTLYSPRGLVAQNDDSLNLTGNSQIVYTLPATLPGNGVYTIEASTYAAGQTGPYTLSLVCLAQPAVATLSVSVGGLTYASGSTVNFGTTPQGAPLPQTFTLTNTGTEDLGVASLNGGGAFSVTGALEQVIQPGQSESVIVTFNATTAGTSGTTMSIGNTTAVNPLTLNLTATATGANTPPTVNVTGLSFNPTSVISGKQLFQN